MTGATWGVAVLFIVLAISRRNGGAAMGIVILSMLVWPEYLRVPVAIAEMSVPRLVGLALLIKFVAQGRHREITYGKVDWLVVLVWLWTAFASMLAGAEAAHIGQMIGRGFDTVLMYFLARIALASIDDSKGLYPAVALTALVMCAAGVYESVSSNSPYQALLAHRGWTWIDKAAQYRYGFLRAQVSTSVSIYFGMAMMLIMGFALSLSGFVRSPLFHRSIVIAALLAGLSSMSSGPWIACFMLLAFYILYANRSHWIRPSLVLLVLLAAAIEIASHRHFYNLIDYLALDPHTAWYRTRLLEIAASRLSEFWLLGFGSTWPNHWADLLDGRNHIDVVNHFLIVAVYGGLPAMFMYIATHIIAIRRSTRAWKEDSSKSRRIVLFGLTATLVALDVSSMSVGLYGPPLLLSHILLGFMVSAATAWGVQKSDARQRQDIEIEGHMRRPSDKWSAV